MAAPQGFEPRYADPESAVLPLNEGAVFRLEEPAQQALPDSMGRRQVWSTFELYGSYPLRRASYNSEEPLLRRNSWLRFSTPRQPLLSTPKWRGVRSIPTSAPSLSLIFRRSCCRRSSSASNSSGMQSCSSTLPAF